MAHKPETKFRIQKVIPFLKTLKHTSYFPIQQVTIVGDADFILCSLGRFVWLELKASDGELSGMQKYKASWVARTGGVVIEARPENWSRVMATLRQLDEGEI